MPVNTSDLSGQGVFSVDMHITYDPAVLVPHPPPVTLGPVCQSCSMTVNNSSPGTLLISLFGQTPMNGAGVLVDLHFNVIGAAGTMSPLNLTLPESPCFTTTNGSVTVIPGSVAGTITYGNAIGSPNPRFVSNVLLTGTGSPNVSTTSGFPGGAYTLSGFGAGSYTITPTKTTGQNGITSFDAAKVAQHAAGLVLLTGNQLVVADVSSNGSVSSFDAALIGKYVVGTPPFGVTGNWVFSPVNRTYPSVTSNLTGQDYAALLMGEVSGNWTSTGAKFVGNRQLAVDSGPVRIIVVDTPNMMVAAGSEIIIPVRVDGAADKGIISFEFDLRYDPSVIQPLADAVETRGTLSRGLTAIANTNEPGLLRVVMYGALPIEGPIDGNGLLLNLRFQALGKPGSVSPLTWERIMFNEGDPQVNATSGQVELRTTEN